MALSNELISQFAKIVNSDKKRDKESTVYGTVVEDENGNKYVKLDGSDQLTPLTDDERPSVESATTSVNTGDRVSVLIKNHTATITGNISSPAVRTGDFNELGDQVSEIKQFDIVIADQVKANKGYIEQLQTDKANVGDLTAAQAKITELETKKASIEQLDAAKAEVTDLVATKIDTEVANAKFATIESLDATNANVSDLSATHAAFETATTNNFTAVNASITDLETNKLSAKSAELKYANIDFSNIGEAAVEKFYAVSGIIQNLTLETGVVVKELVGVLISGDLIQANTIQAEKLVVRGEDGLYYKLNIDSLGEATASSDEKYQNGLDGSVIIAKSITAEKVSVDDLVAFGATIGGFKITSDSIYSGVKSSIDNTTKGLYMDNDGQLCFGDSVNFLKFYTDENGEYKLDISAVDIVWNAVQENSDNIESRATNESVSAMVSRIEQCEKSINMLVRDENNGTLMTVDSDGVYYFNMSDIQKSISKNAGAIENLDSNLSDTNTDLKKVESDVESLIGKTEYIKMGTEVDTDGEERPCLELGEGDSNFKVKITNKEIKFVDGETTPAYITNQKLMIEKAEVRDELKFGNFVWKKRDNGNMGLIWEVTS